jgi:hypothetical protein
MLEKINCSCVTHQGGGKELKPCTGGWRDTTREKKETRKKNQNQQESKNHHTLDL